MKKVLSVILSMCMLFTIFMCFSCSKGKGELVLKQNVWRTYIDDASTIKWWVNFETEEEKQQTEVFAKPKDETLVTVDGETLKVGKKFGKTTVELSTEDKTATLEVEVVSVLEYLEEKSETGNLYYQYYLACSWLLNGMESFRNPDSIEVLYVFPHKLSSGNIDYFIMEIRGQNGFGGNTTDYIMVTSGGISDGFSPYIMTYPIHKLADGFGGQIGGGHYLERALYEYNNDLI